ncbi:MAG: exonuclease VII small subunit [Candidatus Pelagibacter sp.]|jgi:ribosomal protein RSM22 (predicted rRNA methylase)|nr:MAG: exonuclease VII small subunit [Candidatus Pelagibacter sp.]HIC11704.1 exonuclease VII small subunit [Candidatus Pelagibacter sp.]|tara:strand:+ start:510 stop:764 length:255 start_codon:yes stop_codon:yes gene_type:complete
MKDKNLPDDINLKSLNELTQEANKIIEQIEKEKNFENSLDEYQKLIRLNNIIEKKFQNTSKKISLETKDKINKILSKKNEKRIK